MSVFTHAEIEYMRSQRLGRLATVGPDSLPHVVPVAFRYNPDTDTIDIGGHGFVGRKEWRDVERTQVAAFVVDDVLPSGLGSRFCTGREPYEKMSAEAGCQHADLRGPAATPDLESV